MRRAKSEAEVAEAARAWGRMRLLVLAVKDARNGLRCEHEYRGSDAPDDPSEPPCWQTHEWTYDHEPADPGDWCAACLERHKWHLALVAIKRMHGGRLRRLQRVSATPISGASEEETQDATR